MDAGLRFPLMFKLCRAFCPSCLKQKKEQPLQDETSAGACRFVDRQACFAVLSGSGRNFRNVRSYRSGRS